MTIHKALLSAVSALCLAALACSLADNTSSTPAVSSELADITSSAPVVSPEAERTLFSDDFSSTSSGWDQEDYGTGKTDYLDGTYQIQVNEANFDYWANPGLSFDDVVVDVDTILGGGPVDNDFGVICRYQDTDNFYALLISSDGMYGIYRNQTGETMMLGQDGMLPSEAIHTDTPDNHVTASCIGSVLTLSVNGQQVVQVTDSAFSSGDVGLLAGSFDSPGVDMRFDNFVVTKP